MDDSAVAAGELLCESVAVDGVHDGLTDLGEVDRAKVSAEAELAVAGAVIVGRRESFGVLFNDRQSSVGCVAAGDVAQNVDFALLELLVLGLVNDLDVGNGLDGGLVAFRGALKVGVQGQGSGQSGLVPAGNGVRAGVREGGDVHTVGVDHGSHGVGIAVLRVEVAGDVSAFAVVSDVAVVAEPQREVLGRHSGVGEVVVVRQIVGSDGDGEGVVVDQAQAGERHGSVGRGGVIVIADNVHAGHMVAGSSLSGNGGGENEGVNQIVLRGDGGAIGEDEIVSDLDGEGLGAILVVLLFVRDNNGGVPGIQAGDVGLNGAEAGAHGLDVEVGSAGGVLAEGRKAEGAAQVGRAAQDDGVAALRGVDGGINDGVGSAPVRGDLVVLQLCVVDMVVLVGVQGDLSSQVVPSLDVQLPPVVVDLVGGIESFVAFDRLGLVDHCHGEEVFAEFVLDAVNGDISQTVIFLDHVDSDLIANGFVQGDVVGAVLVVAQRTTLDSGLGGVFRGRRGGRLGCVGRRLRLISLAGAADEQRRDHGQRQKKSKQLCKILFHLFSSYIILYLL